MLEYKFVSIFFLQPQALQAIDEVVHTLQLYLNEIASIKISMAQNPAN